MSLVNRGALPPYNAVEQRQIAKKKTKRSKMHAGPVTRFPRGKVKKKEK